ncbi:MULTISPECIES: hypothetical protein [Kribbella]|uniref:Uncharacterized protein n=1 Tax=Kribbella karoonensis TaxID=324851 RepID=A0ABN2CRY1_9ACTN
MTAPDELAVLKTLDPATGADPQSPRAQATLHRILATPAPPPARRHSRWVPRLAIGTGLVAAATAAALVLPSAVGGDQAFATWTGTPSGLTGKAALDASKACRDNSDDQYKNQLATAGTAIAERRGVWTLVVLADRKGFGALCITDRSRHLFRDQFGAIGTTTDLPAPRALTPVTLGTGSSDGHDLSVITGLAGQDVTAVSYASRSHGKVAASVSAGQFALWFPGDELVNANKTGVPVQVTYTDGTAATLTLRL